VLHYASVGLRKLYGYELVTEPQPQRGENETMDTVGQWHFRSTGSRFVIRLCADAAGDKLAIGTKRRPYSNLHSHEMLLAEANMATAAYRGLLMAVLCLLVCTNNQEMTETELFNTLELDQRLQTVAPQEESAGTRRRRSAAAVEDLNALELFQDQGTAAPLLANWRSTISRDMVAAGYLVRTKKGTQPGDAPGPNEEGAVTDPYVYEIGPTSRALVGALSALQVVRTLKGMNQQQAGEHTEEKTRQFLAKEMGTGRPSFTRFLPSDTYTAGDRAAGEGEREGEDEYAAEGAA
jgi:MAGE family